jgi:hypothetical protein
MNMEEMLVAFYSTPYMKLIDAALSNTKYPRKTPEILKRRVNIDDRNEAI